jgi:hypothetical protein
MPSIIPFQYADIIIYIQYNFEVGLAGAKKNTPSAPPQNEGKQENDYFQGSLAVDMGNAAAPGNC